MKTTNCGYYGLDKLDGTDNRSTKWKEQRKERGFDDTEMWSLGDTIANFSIPRIKRMMEIEEQTNKDYDEIKNSYISLLEGLELFVRDNGARIWNEEEEKKVDWALKNFGEMLPAMWF